MIGPPTRTMSEVSQRNEDVASRTSFIPLHRSPIPLLECTRRRVVVIDKLVEKVGGIVRRKGSAVPAGHWSTIRDAGGDNGHRCMSQHVPVKTAIGKASRNELGQSTGSECFPKE